MGDGVAPNGAELSTGYREIGGRRAPDYGEPQRPVDVRIEDAAMLRAGGVEGAGGGLSAKEWFRDLGNMLKAFIGLNFMYASFAFTKAGLIGGTLGLMAILYLTEYCCLQLIRVKNLMPEANDRHQNLTYGDVTLFALGKKSQKIVNFFLVVTQFGFCVGYLIFLSQTAHDLLEKPAPVWVLVLVPLPVLATLALLRSIRSLAFFSNIANVALLLGFVSVTTYICLHFKWQPVHPSIVSFPLFVGQMTAALEGITLVIPVESSMKQRAYFPLILRVALIMMGFVLIVIGVLGMATFGEGTRSIILLNMHGHMVVAAVKLILCLGILFTYPLQLVPILQAMEGWLQGQSVGEAHVHAHPIGAANYGAEASDHLNFDDRLNEGQGLVSSPNGNANNYSGRVSVNDVSGATIDSESGLRKSTFVQGWLSISSRIAVVLATAIVAIFAGESFGLFQSLVGSLGAASLAFTMPPLIYMEMFRSEMTPMQIVANWTIFAFGVVGAVTGTIISLIEIGNGGETAS